MSSTARRMPFVDMLKAVASQLIVLHHLAFYGPMSDVAYPLAHQGIDWLYEYARMAVQVFLVIAGYLAARSLMPSADGARLQPLKLIAARYTRLALPLLAALTISVLSAAFVRQWMDHPSVPEAPGLWQVLSHMFLLQHLLGQESLSAGVWYIAIDFQLFVMLVLTLWAARVRLAAHVLLASMGALSLFYFNRQDAWDNWGIYFFGSYALGIATAWTRQPARLGWAALILAIALAALSFDFRLRIVIALITALCLSLDARFGWANKLPESALLTWLGRSSYSLFLIHFPVCLLVNTALFRLAPNSPALNLAGMLLAWLLSIGAGAIFYYWVELPLTQWLMAKTPAKPQKTISPKDAPPNEIFRNPS